MTGVPVDDPIPNARGGRPEDPLPAAADAAAEEAIRLWRIPGKLRLLGQLDNFTYEAASPRNTLIVRITPESHRSAGQIESELDWVRFLANSGLSVCAPRASAAGRLVESIATDAGTLHASVFDKAPGRMVDVSEHWTPEFQRSLGSLIGRMHAATRRYVPAEGLARRQSWSDDDVLTQSERYLHQNDTTARRELAEVLEWAHALPKTNDSYGLVHTDLNQSNYLIDDRMVLTVFDFDDARYHWLAYDLAMPLFYLLAYSDLPEPDQASRDWFYTTVLDAYSAEYSLGEEWLRRIPGFVRLRRIEHYIVLHKYFDVNRLPRLDRKSFELARDGMNRREPLV